MKIQRRPSQPRPTAVPTAIASPCVRVCRMDPATGHCEGCRRTLDEIAAWDTCSDERRREILTAIDKRNDALFEGGT